VKRQLFIIIFTLLSIVFIGTGLFHISEEKYHKIVDSNNKVEKSFAFHDSLYVIIVTIASVGYGDFAPVTQLGRITIMVLIITTLVLIPIESGKLSETLAERSSILLFSFFFFI
jgi:hypothetical protein